MSETKENIFKIQTSSLRAYTMIAAIALIWVYFHWATGSIFLTPRNLSNLMLQTSVTGIIAVGMLMVIIAGQIDLSVGSVLGFAGAVAAIALARWEFGLPAALLSAIIIGSLIGLAQGALTAYLNIPAFIVTLGGLLAWRGAVKAITKSETIPIADSTFKSIGQSYVSPQLGWILAGAGILFVLFVAFRRAQAQKTYELGEANYAGEMLKSIPPVAAIIIFIYVMNSYAGIPIPVLILLAVALLGVFITNFTTFGRYLYAIGGNPDAARLSGINNKQNIVKVFVLLGALTGVAALIFTARVGSAAPDARKAAKQPTRTARLKSVLRWGRLGKSAGCATKMRLKRIANIMNVECIITVADNKADKQANDVDNLLTQGINVLVIAPQDATQAASMVEKAKAQNVPVISYDRLINSDKIDLYISHQVPVIGRKIAEYALQKVPKGNYIMVYGASTDNNAVIMKKEQLAVLQSAIDSKDITIRADQFITEWKPEEALKLVENTLTQYNDDIQAVVVSNDGMAGGVISALEKKGLTGKVLVTGQDAQKDALQHIAEGKQTMTVYKPIIPLANAAVEAAIKLAKKEPLTDTKPFKNDNIGKEISAILLEVQVVDKDNLMTTVIKDSYAKYEEVYANVPTEKRPPKQ